MALSRVKELILFRNKNKSKPCNHVTMARIKSNSLVINNFDKSRKFNSSHSSTKMTVLLANGLFLYKNSKSKPCNQMPMATIKNYLLVI